MGSLRDRSGCAGHSLVFKSSTWNSSITILECVFILRPLLFPCLSSVILCAGLQCGWQSTLPSLHSTAPSSAVQVVFLLHLLLLSAS